MNCSVSLIALIFFICASSHAITTPHKAFITAPVVDMVGDPLRERYCKDMPISWGPSKEDQICCLRMHQGLFNEIVTVIKIQGDWALVELENCFWQTAESDEKLNQAWMRKKNLVPFDDLEKRNVSAWFIPEPISIKRRQLSSNVITLAFPYFDQLTRKTYSAGTRFVCSDDKKYGYYTVHIFDCHEWQFKKTFIPDAVCHVCQNNKKSDCIADFVALLRSWIRHEGFIPHCWGGTSLTQFYTNVGYSLHAKTIEGKKVQYWQLDDVAKEKVWSGFDASGLPLRAAQICGIPYYFKNSTTAAKNLRALEFYEAVQEGDLIWVPGGLFVISDLTHHRLIGSLGYQHGYGKVVELPMSKLFEGIETMTDLINAYFHQHPLRMKDGYGQVYRTVDQFKILKMKSVW